MDRRVTGSTRSGCDSLVTGREGKKLPRDAFPLRHETRLREVSGGCEVAGGEGDVTATVVTCDSPSGRAVDGHVSDGER